MSDMAWVLGHWCRSSVDAEKAELKSRKIAEHEQGGQINAQRDFPACQIAVGPFVRPNKVAQEGRGIHVVQMDVPAPPGRARSKSSQICSQLAPTSTDFEQCGPDFGVAQPRVGTKMGDLGQSARKFGNHRSASECPHWHRSATCLEQRSVAKRLHMVLAFKKHQES